tara:strand:- start:2233 stop:3264 length:1032 start_codon:yes stop_codon:yes gene_type:complete
MDYIREYIRDNKIYDLSNILENEIQDKDEYMNSFGEMVSLMMEINSPTEMVDHILTSWDLSENDADNIFLEALRTFTCSDDELKFLVEKSTTISGINYMITKIVDSNSFAPLMNVLVRVYKEKLTVNDYLDLKEFLDQYEEATKQQFKHVYSFIEEKLRKTQKKPSWVTLKDDENLSLLNTTSIGMDLEQSNIILNKLSEEVSNYDIEDESLSLFASSVSDNINLEQSYDKSFRVWGPENRFPDRECIGNPDTKGGCRMLRCVCHEEENEWFTGKCDHCEKIIENISFAVRYPKDVGGWVGCYCCFQCMYEYSPETMKAKENARVKNLQLKLKETGIMDRSII